MGLGYHLMEDIVYDISTGRVLNDGTWVCVQSSSSSVEWPSSCWRLCLLPLDSLREHFVMALDCRMMEDIVCDVTADQVLNNGTWVRVHSSFIEWPPSSFWRLCLLPLDSLRDHLLWHWIVTWWNITQASDGTWIYVYSLLTLNRLRSVSSDIWLSSDREHHMWCQHWQVFPWEMGGEVGEFSVFWSFILFFSFSPLNAGSHFYCKCCFCKTKLWKQPFSFMFPKLWTSLPCDNYRLFSLEIVITPEAHDPLVDRSTIYCCINPMKCLWWTGVQCSHLQGHPHRLEGPSAAWCTQPCWSQQLQRYTHRDWSVCVFVFVSAGEGGGGGISMGVYVHVLFLQKKYITHKHTHPNTFLSVFMGTVHHFPLPLMMLPSSLVWLQWLPHWWSSSRWQLWAPQTWCCQCTVYL